AGFPAAWPEIADPSLGAGGVAVGPEIPRPAGWAGMAAVRAAAGTARPARRRCASRREQGGHQQHRGEDETDRELPHHGLLSRTHPLLRTPGRVTDNFGYAADEFSVRRQRCVQTRLLALPIRARSLTSPWAFTRARNGRGRPWVAT